jgi:hypothetical protein
MEDDQRMGATGALGMTRAGLLALVLNDFSAILLIASNLALIGIALHEHWELGSVMLAYWIQSVIIGFFTAVKILSLRQFSTKGVRVNGRPVSESTGTKIALAGFFAVHFGFFHFVYLLFVAGIALSGGSLADDFNGILVASALFFVNHAFSFWYNRHESESASPNIGSVVFLPYARIVPMHLTIIFGFGFLGATGFNAPVLVFFLLLKTAADLLMHLAEHHAANALRVGAREMRSST